MTQPATQIEIVEGIDQSHIEDALRIAHEAFAKKFRHGFRDADDLVRLFHDSVDRTSCYSAIVDGRCLGLLTFATAEQEFFQLSAGALFTRFPPWRALRIMFNLLLLLDHPKDDEWLVESISVSPASRGLGFGTLLMEQAEARARSMGKRRMSLGVIAENEGAIRLYERLGYRITKTMSSFWVRLATASNSVHQMQKPLTPNDG